jgi:preprotein translocase subunit SecF
MDWRNYFRHYSWHNVWLGVLMNANELADELEILSKQFDEAIDLIGKYEIEVRKQQAEIEHLKELFEKAMRMIEK